MDTNSTHKMQPITVAEWETFKAALLKYEETGSHEELLKCASGIEGRGIQGGIEGRQGRVSLTLQLVSNGVDVPELIFEVAGKEGMSLSGGWIESLVNQDCFKCLEFLNKEKKLSSWRGMDGSLLSLWAVATETDSLKSGEILASSALSYGETGKRDIDYCVTAALDAGNPAKSALLIKMGGEIPKDIFDAKSSHIRVLDQKKPHWRSLLEAAILEVKNVHNPESLVMRRNSSL